MKSENRAALNGLRTIASVLGIGLLLAACSGGDDSMSGTMDNMPETPGDDMSGTMDDNDMSGMTDLGAWNMTGTLDVSDANGVLRAYYDMGAGRLAAPAPVQPEGMGTATWTGMWSGHIEVNQSPETQAGLGIIGLTPADLQGLGGGANVTAYFESDGVVAVLTYEDLGIDALGLSEISSDRAPVTGGTFKPAKTFTSPPIPFTFQGTPASLTVMGDFAGEGAFGGSDAEGVAGYMGGEISLEYGRGPRNLGTFQSVFYGTKDGN